MPKYLLTNDALAFLRKIPAKHAKQIMGKIEKIADNPKSIPSKQLEGYPPLRRAKSGEYRIIYRLSDGVVTVFVLRVGKRNDGDVYRGLETLLSRGNEDNMPDETDTSFGKPQGSEEL
jgi:mRNA interferase RelE/StbE